MKKDQIALILYTLRDFCTSEEQLRTTLKRVREIGYQAVQVSGVSGEIAPAVIRSALDEAGLKCCATHDNGDWIRKEPEAVAEKLSILGTRDTAYPYPAGVDFNDPASIDSLVADLSHAGEVLAKAGMRLSYHNHAHEFFRVGGKTVLEEIYERVPAEFLKAELDTFWIQAGGASPLSWIEKMKGRMPLMHLKDYGVNPNGDRHFSEIGSGNLDWPTLIAAAEAAGCEWFIVEQDTCPGDPFESIAKSYKYLAGLCV
ncbi:MAG: sugar phosphate isomerase/epimerase family protein [Puniceicoccaceae bacterium]